MPTLADIYSLIDSTKRRGADFIQNPGASLQQMVGYGLDRANAARDALYQATEEEGIGYGPKTQALAKQMAESYNPIGMTAWHGSPHIFEKFDLGKIGTGEGLQAYGHGLYLAESPNVARGYQKKLSQLSNVVDGQIIRDLPTSVVGNQLKSFGGNVEKTKQYFLSKAAENEKIGQSYKPALDDAAKFKSYADMVENMASKQFEPNKGSLYKVELPDSHVRRMLDFDAPIKEQPMIVRKLAKSLGLDMSDLGGDLLAQVGKDEAGRKIMQNAGIRGVKYLDQNSRFANEGTRNFVVFDPNHMKILERTEK